MFFFLFSVFIKSQFNLKEIEGTALEEFAGKGRPVFMRLVITGCPFAPPSQAQWEKASQLYPQVDFVTYDCWKDNGKGVCTKLGADSSPHHVLIHPDKAVPYENSFGNPPDIEVSPQRFINTIVQNLGLYPLAPPVTALSPSTTDLFLSSSTNPIFLIYNSSKIEDSKFISAWTKVANEELYPDDPSISFGSLDSNSFPDECKRWTQTENLESPIAVIYSKLNHQFTKIKSYYSVLSTVKKSISKLNQITEVIDVPEQTQETPETIPMPTPLPSDYQIIRNSKLESLNQADTKNEYSRLITFNGDGFSGEVSDKQNCIQVQPSSEDHVAALNILNFFRKIVGLNSLTEDSEWSQDCQDTALIIHKIGVIPADHVVDPKRIPSTCTQGQEFFDKVVKTAKLSNLAGNSKSCFESILSFLKDEGKNNRLVAGHRRWLLSTRISTVGMGYYPVKNEVMNEGSNVYIQKPAVGVVRCISDNMPPLAALPEGINFVSYPPAGCFPIDQLPSTWHVSYEGFSNGKISSINDLKIYVTRDDGVAIPFTAKIENEIGETKETLTMYIDPEAMKLCQAMRTINVRIDIDSQKKSIQYSFSLFGNNELAEFCLYKSSASSCPDSISARIPESQITSNNNLKTALKNDENVHVYIAEDVDIGSGTIEIEAQRVFFQKGKLKGNLKIFGSKVEFDDPSQTKITLLWRTADYRIGYLSTQIAPLEIVITQSTSSHTNYQSLPFYNGPRTTSISFEDPIIHLDDYDVFSSFEYSNKELLATSYSLKSYAEFAVNYEYVGAPEAILINSNDQMEKQKVFKKKVKIYTSEKVINASTFIPGSKKDYVIVPSTTGVDFSLVCSKETESRINSLTIEPAESYSSVNTFDLFQVEDLRQKCHIPNVRIIGANKFLSSNYRSFSDIIGDQAALNFYKSDPKRYLEIRPTPIKYTINDVEVDHVLDITYDKSASGTPSYYPIIYTPSNYESYTVIKRNPDQYSFKYPTMEFRPAEGAESKHVTLKYMEEIDKFYFGPQSPTGIDGFWFVGYDDITVQFNFNPIKYGQGPVNIMNKFHFESCKSVKLIGDEEIKDIDPDVVPDPLELKSSIEITKYTQSFNIQTNHPKQKIIADSVVISATTEFNGKNIQTPIVLVKPNCYPVLNEMEITDSIEVDGATLTLNKCAVGNVEISMKKNPEWPQISLQETDFTPKSIKIDLNPTVSSSLLLDDSAEADDDNDFDPHVVFDGIPDGKCDEFKDKITLLNNNNGYNKYCINNQIAISKVNPENPENPGEPVDPENPDKPGNPDDSNGKPKSSGLTPGEKAGISIGVILGVALIAGIVAFVIIRKKNKDKSSNDSAKQNEA